MSYVDIDANMYSQNNFSFLTKPVLTHDFYISILYNKVRKFDKNQISDETKQNFDLNYYTVQP